MKKLIYLGLIFLISGVAFSVNAQEDAIAQDEASKAKSDAAEPAKKNPVVEAAQDFTKGLNEKDKMHFNVLYTNYNLTKVVEVVEKDVGIAVTKCSEANPDMKEPLNNRYTEWKDKIKPVMTDAEANINNMVFAQSYADPKKVKEFFKTIDRAREEQEKKIEKVPVTSKEACEYLLKTMDSTQEKMISLLGATLVSLPQIMQEQEKAKAQKQEKEQEKSEEKSEETQP